MLKTRVTRNNHFKAKQVLKFFGQNWAKVIVKPDSKKR